MPCLLAVPWLPLGLRLNTANTFGSRARARLLPDTPHVHNCRIGGFQDASEISSSQALADRLFVTMYMGTVNSSIETAQRAKKLAKEIGAYHFQIAVDSVVCALVGLFVAVTGAPRTYGAAYCWVDCDMPHVPGLPRVAQGADRVQAALHSLRPMAAPRPRIWRCRTYRRVCAW